MVGGRELRRLVPTFGHGRQHQQVNEGSALADADERQAPGVATEGRCVETQPVQGRYDVQHPVIALNIVPGTRFQET